MMRMVLSSRDGDRWERLIFTNETFPGCGIPELLDLVLGWRPSIDDENTIRLSRELNDANGVDTGHDVGCEVDRAVLGTLNL